ncbi:tetratricopeptide repeat protein [Candidatus Binatia bacterium]|nr:tetratricopeptide repeat protein [Candidatus Binatia bacterium]
MRPAIVAVTVLLAGLVAGLFMVLRDDLPDAQDILTSSPSGAAGRLTVTYPLDGTLFPPEIVAPTFVWDDRSAGVDRWFVVTQFGDGEPPFMFSASERRWRPSEQDWAQIKRRSLEKDATVVVAGVDSRDPAKILSSARVRIQTSTDEVGDSIFYREVPLPFLSAVRDPSRIRWRFGSIDSEAAPPIVLQDLPVCGNCHSFSANGRVLGLDVDYGNDKGAYAILPVAKEMRLDDSKIITWADYKRDDGELTFGLLSQVSPNGRYVVSTLKDRSVFVATPEITFSQLFFPIKGVLVTYDRETKSFQPLRGADDPEFVQSNPTWSPDGKRLIFAKAKVYQAERISQIQSILLSEKEVPEFVSEKRPFRYDLHTIPFNDGQGGTPEPLPGASGNGMSNYFPKYSPDGKWVVFCKARSYMLLQPDSELYIMPAQGGEPRRLRANTPRMNSWHSWSSNSRWLVFSSKWNTPYTQLFLTHIDENGEDSPPVLLERFTATDRAANIPEFVRLAPDEITHVREEFLDAYSFLRAGEANERTGDHAGAERAFRRGLKVEPSNPDLLNALGWTLFQQARTAEAIEQFEQALRANPKHAKANNNLALALIDRGDPARAVEAYRASLAVEPKAEIYSDLGFVLQQLGRKDEAIDSYRKAIDLDPECGPAHFNLAVALLGEDKFEEAALHYEKAIAASPSAEAHNGLGFVLDKLGKNVEAIAQFRRAIEVDPAYVPAYNNLGEVYVKEGKLDDAVSAYRDSLKQRPSAAIRTDLATALWKQGKTQDAIRELQDALKVDPGNARARHKLEAMRGAQMAAGKAGVE